MLTHLELGSMCGKSSGILVGFNFSDSLVAPCTYAGMAPLVLGFGTLFPSECGSAGTLTVFLVATHIEYHPVPSHPRIAEDDWVLT